MSSIGTKWHLRSTRPEKPFCGALADAESQAMLGALLVHR